MPSPRPPRHLTFFLLCAVSALVVAGAASSTALASSLRLSSATRSARPETGVHLAVAVSAPAQACRLVASTKGRSTRTLSMVAATNTQIEWRWRVPAHAHGATWRLRVTCGSATASTVLVVYGQRRGPLVIAHRVHVLQRGPAISRGSVSVHMRAAAPVSRLTPERAQAQAWWTSNANSILAGFHTGASAGQCTDYVARRRPDVIESGDVWAYTQYLMGPRDGPVKINWAAKGWVRNAKHDGMSTGNVPRPGAVVVFQPGAYGAAAPDGHVAIVDQVRRDGSFTISEMHAPVLGKVSSRSFDARIARSMTSNRGVTFIYR